MDFLWIIADNGNKHEYIYPLMSIADHIVEDN